MPGPNSGPENSDTTMSGRCLRIESATASRSALLLTIRLSGNPRNSTVSTPTCAADRRCSSSRIGPAIDGAIPSIPASPLEANTYTTLRPSAVHRATAADMPYSGSSGCATRTRQRVQSVGKGSGRADSAGRSPRWPSASG